MHTLYCRCPLLVLALPLLPQLRRQPAQAATCCPTSTTYFFPYPTPAPQCTLIFYMYHIDAKMMGRAAGKQYPQMLAKHFSGRLGLPAATLVFLAQVRVYTFTKLSVAFLPRCTFSGCACLLAQVRAAGCGYLGADLVACCWP